MLQIKEKDRDILVKELSKLPMLQVEGIVVFLRQLKEVDAIIEHIENERGTEKK